MDQEILVNGCRRVMQQLQRDGKHISLFMLNAIFTDMDTWNLMISAVEYDHVTRKTALNQVIAVLRELLSEDSLTHILRITILKTSDPFVKAVNQRVRLKNSVQFLHDAVIAGVEIEQAIILASRSWASRSKSKKRAGAALEIAACEQK